MLRSTRIPETTTETHHSPRRQRNERGLTTLEWLLIVAAVAGLAALAVVLVQNVVDDTAEQIAGSSARLTAASVAAAAITSDFKTADDEAEKIADGTAKINKKKEVKDKAASACRRLNITYSDVLSDTQEAKWEDDGHKKVLAVINTPKEGDLCHVPDCMIRLADVAAACAACGRAVPAALPRGRDRLYCSAACRERAKSRRRRGLPVADADQSPRPAECAVCGAPLPPPPRRGPRGRYCSPRCSRTAKSRRARARPATLNSLELGVGRRGLHKR